MTTPPAQIAVYIDFDNIVISRYDLVHGKGSFQKHKVRETPRLPETVLRSVEATVDLESILDFADSLGTVALIRAYADWSAPFNSRYREPLTARAVDLTQLFPATALNKNSADIRLAVDVVEDLFRLDHLTHVVLVSGDADFVPLAQRVRRLGRHAVGIGMAGATSAALVGACTTFIDYDTLPGTPRAHRSHAPTPPAATVAPAQVARKNTIKPAGNTPKKGPTSLLVRALRVSHGRNGHDDAGWLLPTTVMAQMCALDPTFTVKGAGHASFMKFIASRSSVVEVDATGDQKRIRLRPAFMVT